MIVNALIVIYSNVHIQEHILSIFSIINIIMYTQTDSKEHWIIGRLAKNILLPLLARKDRCFLDCKFN